MKPEIKEILENRSFSNNESVMPSQILRKFVNRKSLLAKSYQKFHSMLSMPSVKNNYLISDVLRYVFIWSQIEKTHYKLANLQLPQKNGQSTSQQSKRKQKNLVKQILHRENNSKPKLNLFHEKCLEIFEHDQQLLNKHPPKTKVSRHNSYNNPSRQISFFALMNLFSLQD